MHDTTFPFYIGYMNKKKAFSLNLFSVGNFDLSLLVLEIVTVVPFRFISLDLNFLKILSIVSILAIEFHLSENFQYAFESRVCFHFTPVVQEASINLTKKKKRRTTRHF